jgi:Family of unknown function (DUF6152)
MKGLPRTLAVFCTVIGMAAGIQAAVAHHSGAMFDSSKLETLNGTVVELRWTNPHVTMLVNGTVKDGDQPSDWLMETTSPGNLGRVAGWTRNSVRAGDKVTIEMAPLRDPDKQGGSIKKVTLVATGESFSVNIRDQEKPDIE